MNALADLSRVADAMAARLAIEPAVGMTGKVLEVIGTLVRVVGLEATLGELCELRGASGALIQHAEVVGFTRNVALLSPFGTLGEINRGTRVIGLRRPLSVKVGNGILGRVIDSFGEPIDGRGELDYDALRPVIAAPPNPMSRRMVDASLATGVRIVDGLITLGEGQRMGIFAPAGVGKSTLLGMFARGASCDVNVIALIGERGREVSEFVERMRRSGSRDRTVVVYATSDRSSVDRCNAALVATTIAEYFRDLGCDVMLFLDSMTRYARALRDLALATGEAPARRGYPASVFEQLPRLLERPGRTKAGSITAFYTVLLENEEEPDPIGDEIRSIVDGHVYLSRQLGAKGHFPAIDVLRSASRLFDEIADAPHRALAKRFRQHLARIDEMQVFLDLGEYRRGENPENDDALDRRPALDAFLQQAVDEASAFGDTLERLSEAAS